MKKIHVPFANLSYATKLIEKKYLAETKKFLKENYFILGPRVEAFEKKFAEMLRVRCCVGVSNGSDALYLALMAIGVTSGDEVITQGNAYNATVVAILRTGAIPRFADVTDDTLTLNPNEIHGRINKKTKAILPVHLYGQMCEMSAVSAIAENYNLRIVEDCAQAHFATWDEKFAGTYGDIGAFSFYPTKNLGAFGDAGAVVTQSINLANDIRMRRSLGENSKNNHLRFGFNMRLDPLQALCLTLKLKHIEKLTQLRRNAAEYYTAMLKPHTTTLPLRLIAEFKEASHAYHLYVVRIKNGVRNEVMEKLRAWGVETAVHYPVPVYQQPFYWLKNTDSCSNTERACNEVLSLPLFPGITKKQQEYVVESLVKVLS